MGEKRTGLTAALVVATIVAVIFIVLWYMRGDDNARLTESIRSEQRLRSDDVSRLESAASGLRQELDTANRRIRDLEMQANNEKSRADRAAAEIERTSQSNAALIDDLRRQVSESETALAQAISEKEELTRQLGETPGISREEAEELRAKLAAAVAELETLRRNSAQLSDVKTTSEAEITRLSAALSQAQNDLAAAVSGSGLDVEHIIKAEQDARNEIARLVQSENQMKEQAGKQAEALRAAREQAARSLQAEKEAKSELAKQSDSLKAAQEKLASLAKAEADAKSELARQSEALQTATAQIAAMADSGKQDARQNAEALQKANAEIARLSAALDELKESSPNREEIDALSKNLEEQRALAVMLDNENRNLNARLAERERQLEAIAELEEMVAGLETAGNALRSEIEAAKQTLAVREAEFADILAAAGAERNRLIEKSKKDAADLNRRIAALTSQVGSLETAMADQKTALAEEMKKLQEANADLQMQVANLEKAFGIDRPGRSVGKVVDTTLHNKTVVIDLGADHRVRPGLKFAVYRPLAGGRRYIGMVKILKISEDTAIASSTLRSEPVMVCPATGFAVLEPGARFSPFAAGKDGKPLALVEIDSLDIPIEAPGQGDLLDNPFVDRSKQLNFVIADGAFASLEEGKKLVETLGGAPKQWNTTEHVDFAIVKEGDTPRSTSWPNSPRYVTKEFIQRFYEPLTKAEMEPPSPCGQPNCLPMR